MTIASLPLSMILRRALEAIERGELVPARFSVTDEQTLEVSFTLVAPAPADRPPLTCPACSAAEPLDVSSNDSGGNLDLLCKVCHHRWHVPRED